MSVDAPATWGSRTVAEGEGRITKLVYDSLGNLQQIQRKNGTGQLVPFLTFTHDSDGQQLTATDAEGQKATHEYDLVARRVATEDLAQNRTELRYDAVGNLTRVLDPEQEEHLFFYDDLDRLIRTEEPGVTPAVVTRLSYDAASNVTGVTDGEDHTTSYEFDGLSRLEKVIRPLTVTAQ